MNTLDIFMYALSFIMAFIGIFISWIGAINASKANDKLTNFLSSTWVEDEAKKLFFEQMKGIEANNVNLNKELLQQQLMKKPDISYFRYSVKSRTTRLPFISHRIDSLLELSKYATILKTYKNCKEKFDVEFSKIFDLKKLNTLEFINEQEIYLVMKYHQALAHFCSIMIKEYSLTTQNIGVN